MNDARNIVGKKAEVNVEESTIECSEILVMAAASINMYRFELEN